MGSSYLLDKESTFQAELVRLGLQAKVLIAHDLPVLQDHGLRPYCSILDLGCGTADYLAELSQHLPASRLYGLDRNPGLLKAAQARLPNATFALGLLERPEELEQTLLRADPDVILMRFVLQHLTHNEIEAVTATLSRARRSGRRVILIDVDDSQFIHTPKDSAITELLRAKAALQAQRGGNRCIGSSMRALLSQSGFTGLKETKLTLGAAALGWESFKQVMWPILQSGVDPITSSELLLQGEQWFDLAARDRTAEASFTYYFTSGE